MRLHGIHLDIVETFSKRGSSRAHGHHSVSLQTESQEVFVLRKSAPTLSKRKHIIEIRHRQLRRDVPAKDNLAVQDHTPVIERQGGIAKILFPLRLMSGIAVP